MRAISSWITTTTIYDYDFVYWDGIEIGTHGKLISVLWWFFFLSSPLEWSKLINDAKIKTKTTFYYFIIISVRLSVLWVSITQLFFFYLFKWKFYFFPMEVNFRSACVHNFKKSSASGYGSRRHRERRQNEWEKCNCKYFADSIDN